MVKVSFTRSQHPISLPDLASLHKSSKTQPSPDAKSESGGVPDLMLDSELVVIITEEWTKHIVDEPASIPSRRRAQLEQQRKRKRYLGRGAYGSGGRMHLGIPRCRPASREANSQDWTGFKADSLPPGT